MEPLAVASDHGVTESVATRPRGGSASAPDHGVTGATSDLGIGAPTVG